MFYRVFYFHLSSILCVQFTLSLDTISCAPDYLLFLSLPGSPQSQQYIFTRCTNIPQQKTIKSFMYFGVCPKIGLDSQDQASPLIISELLVNTMTWNIIS